jgi:hypothetical protein
MTSKTKTFLAAVFFIGVGLALGSLGGMARTADESRRRRGLCPACGGCRASGSFGDLDLSVKFKAVSGKVDQAKPTRDHRNKRDGYIGTVAGIRIEVSCNRITAISMALRKIDTSDSTFTAPRKIGLWTLKTLVQKDPWTPRTQVHARLVRQGLRSPDTVAGGP